MSLTTDIAELVGEYRALAKVFDAKKAVIDASVTAAIAALPGMTRTYYIDAVNGIDTNDGLTAATPLQTINKAFALAGPGRDIKVMLMSDYTLATTINVPQSCKVLIMAHDFDLAASPNVRRKLTLALYPNTDANQVGVWVMAGFRLSSAGDGTFDFVGIEVVLPSAPAAGALISSNYNALVGQNSNFAPGLIVVQLRSCTITTPASPAGWIVGITSARAAVLIVNGVTYTAAAMAGRWISGFAAGADPAASRRILSNLATL